VAQASACDRRVHNHRLKSVPLAGGIFERYAQKAAAWMNLSAICHQVRTARSLPFEV
jgi:hypothetical protein